MATEPEPEFSDDVGDMKEAVNSALNELAEVKAYTLTVEELRDFKAAQYALRNLSEDYAKTEDVPELYEARVEVRGNERELKDPRE